MKTKFPLSICLVGILICANLPKAEAQQFQYLRPLPMQAETYGGENIVKFKGYGPFTSHQFDVDGTTALQWLAPGATLTVSRMDGSGTQMIKASQDPDSGFKELNYEGSASLNVNAPGDWIVIVIHFRPGSSISLLPQGLAMRNGLYPNPAQAPPPGGVQSNQSFQQPYPQMPQHQANPQMPGFPQTAFNTPPVSPQGTLPGVSPASNAALGDTSVYSKPTVIIRGARGEATGFLVKMPQGTCILTNQHVVANNLGFTFETVTGLSLIPTALLGASDRDLALIVVKDDGTLPTLTLATNVDTSSHAQDQTIVPGNSQGGGVVVYTPGNIVGIGPAKVEISNPIFPGNSGSPVIDLNLKQAIGVVAEAEKSDADGWLNESSLANPDSAIKSVRYFSVRADNVSSWVPMDFQRFYNQTHYLDQMHDSTLQIISLLKSVGNTGGQENNDYLKNAKLADLMSQYKTTSFSGLQSSDQDDAFKKEALMSGVKVYAETDINSVKRALPSLYPFVASEAKDEVDFRQAVIDHFFRN